MMIVALSLFSVILVLMIGWQLFQLYRAFQATALIKQEERRSEEAVNIAQKELAQQLAQIGKDLKRTVPPPASKTS